MSNKKISAIILSAVIVLSSVIGIAAYKIISSKLGSTSNPNVQPEIVNNQMFIDTVDYSENLLDSNFVYKEKFESNLKGSGKWVPVRASDLVKDLTNQSQEPIVYDPPARDQYVSNEQTTESKEEYVTDEIGSNITYDTPPSTDNSSNQVGATETEKALSVKIVYIWKPDCATNEWNPYNNGRWEFTYHGWQWVSNYSWGSNCYNYGRWFWSSFYGWVWMPGSAWAPNWVTWRHCEGYYGWYPMTPRIWWRDYHSNLVVCNPHVISNPQHWTFVTSIGITKPITRESVIDPVKNIDILKNSEKIKTTNVLAIDGENIKYNGPSVTKINQVVETPIKPTKGNDNETKTVKTPTTTKSSNPTKTFVINDVSSPTPVSTPTNTTTSPGPVKTPIKTPTTKYDPSTTTKGETTTKTSTSPTKSQVMPKNDTPTKQTTTKEPTTKQPTTKTTTPPVKQQPPKYDTPKYNPPPPTKQEPPKYNPPPVKYDPPPPPPPVKYDPPPPPPPVKNDPPPPPPPVKNDPPPPPPPTKDDGKKGD